MSLHDYPWIPDGSDPDDWHYAIEAAAQDTATATAPPEPATPLTVAHIAEVDTFHIAYHGQTWRPGGVPGTELGLTAVLRLIDDRWASLEAWNDYTGWGCQDGATVRIGPDRDTVVRFGLTAEGRRHLGIEDGTS